MDFHSLVVCFCFSIARVSCSRRQHSKNQKRRNTQRSGDREPHYKKGKSGRRKSLLLSQSKEKTSSFEPINILSVLPFFQCVVDGHRFPLLWIFRIPTIITSKRFRFRQHYHELKYQVAHFKHFCPYTNVG